MIYLNDLQFIPGSMKKRKRVARGNAGKATGRGFKGQKARSGVSLSNFQGGQTPIERRVPKHNSFFRKKTEISLSLARLESLFESKIVDTKTILTRDLLEKLKIVKKNLKYKLIGSTNRLINIEADSSSEGAINSIKNNGGSIKLIKEISNNGDSI